MQIYLLVKKQNKKANAPILMRIKINYEKKTYIQFINQPFHLIILK